MVRFFVWEGLEKSVVEDLFACNHGQLGTDAVVESFWTEK